MIFAVTEARHVKTLLVSVIALLTFNTAAASTIWDFRTGGSPMTVVGSAWGNVRTFTMGTETVRVTAWADDGTTPPLPSFASAYSGQYSTGLGICNRTEAILSGSLLACRADGGSHDQVDNLGENDFMLFEFSAAQAMEWITIDPYGLDDRDVTYWIGNVTSPLNLAGLTFSDLPGLGFGPATNVFSGVSSDALTINLGNVSGNAILFGALYPPNGTADKFKIQSIRSTSEGTTIVPVPAAFWLFGSATALLAAARRRALRTLR